MKFSCKKCNGEITNFSVMKTYTFREDYGLIKVNTTGTYQQFDREYYISNVEGIIANCKNCGEIELDKTDKNLQDFVRDSDQIEEEDIKNNEYGNCILVKSKDNLVVTIK